MKICLQCVSFESVIKWTLGNDSIVYEQEQNTATMSLMISLVDWLITIQGRGFQRSRRRSRPCQRRWSIYSPDFWSWWEVGTWRRWWWRRRWRSETPLPSPALRSDCSAQTGQDSIRGRWASCKNSFAFLS